MANTISPYFSDENLCSQLRQQFDYDEMWDINFFTVFNQIIDRDTDFYLELRGKKFSIDKNTGVVKEVE